MLNSAFHLVGTKYMKISFMGLNSEYWCQLLIGSLKIWWLLIDIRYRHACLYLFYCLLLYANKLFAFCFWKKKSSSKKKVLPILFRLVLLVKLIILAYFYLGIQLGQALSTRPDILPPVYCQELAKLQVYNHFFTHRHKIMDHIVKICD